MLFFTIASVLYFLLLLLLFGFNWSIIALWGFVGFCCTMKWMGYMCVYIPSFLSLPPITPSYPSRSSQSTELSSLCQTATGHLLSVLPKCTRAGAALSICLTLSSPLPAPHVHKSLLYVHVSIPALKIGSSALFFWWSKCFLYTIAFNLYSSLVIRYYQQVSVNIAIKRTLLHNIAHLA